MDGIQPEPIRGLRASGADPTTVDHFCLRVDRNRDRVFECRLGRVHRRSRMMNTLGCHRMVGSGGSPPWIATLASAFRSMGTILQRVWQLLRRRDHRTSSVGALCSKSCRRLTRCCRKQAEPDPLDTADEADVLEALFAAQKAGHQFRGVGSNANLFDPSVWRVSERRVVKVIETSDFHEPWALKLVNAHTSIPCGTLRRIVTTESSQLLLIDYIKGENLLDAWPRMGFLRRLWTCWTIRGYIRQLRQISVPADFIGAFDPDLAAGPRKPVWCRGFAFGEYGGPPFSSMSALAKWFSRQAKWSHLLATERGRSMGPVSFDDSQRLVFVHGDLSPNNIIVDRRGLVHLIDWNRAGVYPEGFEYAGIVAYRHQELYPQDWFSWARFIAGDFKKQNRILLGCSAARAQPHLEGYFDARESEVVTSESM